MRISFQNRHRHVEEGLQFPEDRILRLDGKDDHCGKKCDEETAQLHQAGGEKAGEYLLRGGRRQGEGEVSALTEQPVIEAPDNNHQRNCKHSDHQYRKSNCRQDKQDDSRQGTGNSSLISVRKSVDYRQHKHRRP